MTLWRERDVLDAILNFCSIVNGEDVNEARLWLSVESRLHKRAHTHSAQEESNMAGM